jgi:plastocyanin
MFKQYVWALIFIGIVCLPSLFLSTLPSFLTAQEKSGKVEIVIRNFTFEFRGGALRPNEPGTIILRNQDKVKHGFTSPLLQEVDVQVEAGGVTTYGKGIKGVYINPGQTVQIHFVPNRPGRFRFRCDIHPNMKGELLLLSIGAA